MNIHDHGESDPIPFDLGSWAPVADAIRRDLEWQMGRVLMDVETEGRREVRQQ